MAVDLHTSLPSQILPEDPHRDLPSPSQHNHSPLKPLTQAQTNNNLDDFATELTHHMPHFVLPDDNTFDFSSTASQSQNFESEPSSPPATPEECCWKSGHDVSGMLEKMKLDGREKSKHQPGYEMNQSSNMGLCSYQSLIQEQIRAIELSRLKQEPFVSPKPKAAPNQKSEAQIAEPRQFPKKGGVGRRARPQRPGPQQAGQGMRAVFLDGPGSRGGTGVFLPRGGPTVPSESPNKQGKGCSTVLIPARVVQALQLHFDQMASTSGPKAGGFPPLHDVLVSNRDGMYSLQKRESMKAPASIQNDMILPQEWTY
ncbi:uncharacterized protein LOC113856142 [Abrus precatorius]|uniref:Uncharacterized protein LOC113856142 n=1 Tax=Abrus precatorius TaxID=3816 RepID=A0A8B8KLD4_ABRPR|nr:uncharacterized protein LOC113856142 [Abrus precatorius]